MTRIPRPCLTCGTPTTNGTRCPTCTPTYTQRRRINGWDWAAIRHAIRTRDNHQCTRCGSTHQLEVHHITPLAAGGTHHHANLTTLCHHCHTTVS